MSRRTSKASKAIREAWENERQLVMEGKGTRNWTCEQQQSIIEKGKAYDDDGRAFEGHHMKSAEAYPEFQGDAENIQFLTRSEHQDAHGGSYRNPTNGCYDPVSKDTRDFGENRYEACEIIELSDPAITRDVIIRDTEESSKDSLCEKESFVEENGGKQLPTDDTPSKDTGKATRQHPSSTSKALNQAKAGRNFGDRIQGAIDAIKVFGEKHPVLAGIAKDVVVVGGIVAAAVVHEVISENRSPNDSSSRRSSDSSSTYDYEESYSSPEESEGSSESTSERDYPDERLSPREHVVSGYDRQQNGRTVHVNSHKRGGKNKDTD